MGSEKTHTQDTECICPETDEIPAYMRPIGIFGATPMDLLDFDTTDTIKDRAACCAGDARVFGESVRDFEEAASFRENLVISPSGLAAASYMEKNMESRIRSDIRCQKASSWQALHRMRSRERRF